MGSQKPGWLNSWQHQNWTVFILAFDANGAVLVPLLSPYKVKHYAPAEIGRQYYGELIKPIGLNLRQNKVACDAVILMRAWRTGGRIGSIWENKVW